MITTQTPAERSLLRFLSRHIVALCGKYTILGPDGEPAGPPRAYSYTGCVFRFGDDWFIATAGHCLKQLQERLSNPVVKVFDQGIVDFCGEGAWLPYPTPFYPMDEVHFCLDDEKLGLDFGLIRLRETIRKGLKANNIDPFEPAQWMPPEGLTFDALYLLGFPTEYTTQVHDEAGNIAVSRIKAALVPLRQLDDDSTTRFSRLKTAVKDMGSQQSIVGMSGGPIIGVFKNDTGYAYYLLAIQSFWRDRGALYACPVRTFIDYISKKLDEAAASKSASKPGEPHPG